MDQIRQHLWIGNYHDGAGAKPEKIHAIVNVAREIDYRQPDGIEIMKVPLDDDASNSLQDISDAASAIDNFVSKGKNTLIHCRAGVSRSACVAALYLHDYEGWGLNGALEHIQRCRPIVEPRNGMWFTTMLAAERTGMR